MAIKISKMIEAGLLDGSELVEVSKLSDSVTKTATTISAASADNSFSDSGNGFITAGFGIGDTVNVTGFSNPSNNIFSATITIISPGKITIGGADGNVIVNESAGASVTITRWETVRTTTADVAALAETSSDSGGGSAGRHAVPIMAGSITPSATGGCAPLATIATSANQPDLQYLAFDPNTQEYAQFSIRMPKSWNEGTLTYVPIWSHGATTVNFGVVWNLQAVAVGNDDTIAVNYGTAQTSTDTGGTTDDLYIGPESSAITVAGSPGAEEVVFFRLSRVTGDGGDTLAVDARLHGITLYMDTDAGTDA